MPRPRNNRNLGNDKTAIINQGENSNTSSGAKAVHGNNATSVKRSTIPELVILTHGSPNNLLDFRKKLSVYAMRVFKDLGEMIELEQYYVPTAIQIPPAEEFEEANDPGGLKQQLLSEQIKQRQRIISEMEQNRPALYAVIWGQHSYESEEAIKQDPNRDAIEGSAEFVQTSTGGTQNSQHRLLYGE